MEEKMSDNDIIQEAIRLVNEGMKVTLKVRGRSMLPFIIGGRDSVVLEKSVNSQPGDVVLAWCMPGHYVIHRIISIDGEKVTLMGDGNLAATEQCRLSDIKAKATHVIRGADDRQRPLYSRKMRRAAKMWQWAKPIRRYLLFIVRLKIKYNYTL